MAKHVRRPSSPAQAKRARPGGATPADTAVPARTSGPGTAAPGQSSYADAVATYEQAMRMLQQRNYARAAELFRHVAARYPDEGELVERARTYTALCERQLSPPPAEPATVPERLYAATLALNAGQTDRALALLEAVRAADPQNDQALYMMGIAHADRGEPKVAIPYLRQAIALNPENRSLARLDPDLEDLRAAGELASLITPGAGPDDDAGDGPSGPTGSP